jgi:hypothetical protein
MNLIDVKLVNISVCFLFFMLLYEQLKWLFLLSKKKWLFLSDKNLMFNSLFLRENTAREAPAVQLYFI